MKQALVSIITPTYNRAHYINVLYEFVLSQTYPNVEWIIYDDSDQVNTFLQQKTSSNIKYIHVSDRMSVGQKRNALIEKASGEFIVQFDDDDFYAPEYITKLMGKMLSDDLDFILFSGFFCYHLDLNFVGYYRTHLKKGPAYQFNKNGITSVLLEKQNIPLIHFCYGWTYFFKKEVWLKQPFTSINVFEDRSFLISAIQNKFKVYFYEDQIGIAAHSVHKKSSSVCYPQNLIPDFMANHFFGSNMAQMLKLRKSALDSNV